MWRHDAFIFVCFASKPFEVGGKLAAAKEGFVEVLAAFSAAAEAVEVFTDVLLATAQFNPCLNAVGYVFENKACPLLTIIIDQDELPARNVFGSLCLGLTLAWLLYQVFGVRKYLQCIVHTFGVFVLA
jgi:hypothetical protein